MATGRCSVAGLCKQAVAVRGQEGAEAADRRSAKREQQNTVARYPACPTRTTTSLHISEFERPSPSARAERLTCVRPLCIRAAAGQDVTACGRMAYQTSPTPQRPASPSPCLKEETEAAAGGYETDEVVGEAPDARGRQLQDAQCRTAGASQFLPVSKPPTSPGYRVCLCGCVCCMLYAVCCTYVYLSVVWGGAAEVGPSRSQRLADRSHCSPGGVMCI